MNFLDEFQRRCFEWSLRTFGERGPEGPLNHMRKEIDEALADPSDIVEFGDLYLLLSDAASRAGHSMSEVYAAAAAKFEVNKTRQWGKPNAEGFCEHVRSSSEESSNG